MSRPLVLIPSSKAKAEGGRTPIYRASPGVRRGPIARDRREVLAALEAAADELDDAGIARLCGVGADDVPAHRRALAELGRTRTLPAHQRYTGVVHRFAGLADVDPAAAAAEVGIVGGLLGIAMLDEAVPTYRLEVGGRVPGLGVLGTWWKQRLGGHLRRLVGSRRCWDLLPGEFARLWPAKERLGLDVVTVRFERPDGRAAPSASAKVAKGELLRLLLDGQVPGFGDLVTRQPLVDWRFEERGPDFAAVQRT